MTSNDTASTAEGIWDEAFDWDASAIGDLGRLPGVEPDECGLLEAGATPASPYEERLARLRFTHAGRAADLRSHARMAHVVAAAVLGQLIHVGGLGWHYWDGTRFRPDPGAKAATRQILLALVRMGRNGLEDKEWRADWNSAQSSSGLSGVLRILEALEGVATEADELDADPLLLNVANGVLDLRQLQPDDQGFVRSWRDLELLPHGPEYLMTEVTRAIYDRSAGSTLWSGFLDRSLPDEDIRAYLQRAVGVALIGRQVQHLLPILEGAGRNGKGVFYTSMHHCLGTYSHVASASLLALVDGDPNRPQPAFLALRGKRLVWVSETAKAAQMDSALIKRLTGGDPITARNLQDRTEMTFDPAHQLMLITNHPPQLPADDPAVWERVRRVHWDAVIPKEERDPELDMKLKAERDTILGWMLAGLESYNRAGGLSEPDRVVDDTDGYKADQDTVTRFLHDRCDDCSPADGDSTKVLHADYQKYCRANGVLPEHMLGERDFSARLQMLSYEQAKSNGRRFWRGLKLAPDDAEARAAQARQELLQHSRAHPTPPNSSNRVAARTDSASPAGVDPTGSVSGSETDPGPAT